MKKVFVIYFDDENGGTYTIGITSTFEKAEKVIKDNFKVLDDFCDSNMVTYETNAGLFTIQEWDVDTIDKSAVDFYVTVERLQKESK